MMRIKQIALLLIFFMIFTASACEEEESLLPTSSLVNFFSENYEFLTTILFSVTVGIIFAYSLNKGLKWNQAASTMISAILSLGVMIFIFSTGLSSAVSTYFGILMLVVPASLLVALFKTKGIKGSSFVFGIICLVGAWVLGYIVAPYYGGAQMGALLFGVLGMILLIIGIFLQAKGISLGGGEDSGAPSEREAQRDIDELERETGRILDPEELGKRIRKLYNKSALRSHIYTIFKKFFDQNYLYYREFPDREESYISKIGKRSTPSLKDWAHVGLLLMKLKYADSPNDLVWFKGILKDLARRLRAGHKYYKFIQKIAQRLESSGNNTLKEIAGELKTKLREVDVVATRLYSEIDRRINSVFDALKEGNIRCAILMKEDFTQDKHGFNFRMGDTSIEIEGITGGGTLFFPDTLIGKNEFVTNQEHFENIVDNIDTVNCPFLQHHEKFLDNITKCQQLLHSFFSKLKELLEVLDKI